MSAAGCSRLFGIPIPASGLQGLYIVAIEGGHSTLNPKVPKLLLRTLLVALRLDGGYLRVAQD